MGNTLRQEPSPHNIASDLSTKDFPSGIPQQETVQPFEIKPFVDRFTYLDFLRKQDPHKDVLDIALNHIYKLDFFYQTDFFVYRDHLIMEKGWKKFEKNVRVHKRNPVKSG